jgi:hypothetical protein
MSPVFYRPNMRPRSKLNRGAPVAARRRRRWTAARRKYRSFIPAGCGDRSSGRSSETPRAARCERPSWSAVMRSLQVARVAGRHRDVEPFLLQLLAHPLEPLVARDGDRSGVGLALGLARRIFDVGLHQCLDVFIERHQRPGVFRIVVHEDVVALLRVRPQIKDLGNGRDIFRGALPAEIAVDRETAGLLPIVAAQVEHRLEATDANRPRGSAHPR